MTFWNKKDASQQASLPAGRQERRADVGRNDPCPCGSGKKYKKCCMAKDEAAEHKTLEANWSKLSNEAKAQAEKKEKENPSSPAKHGGPKPSTQQRHPSFVPPQTSLPRKSGGGG